MDAQPGSGRIRTIVVALALAAGAGCALDAPPASPAASVPARELTAGLVQRDVHAGMAAAEVVAALGSPNIVTRGSDGREVWVWDRVATDTTTAENSGSIAGVVSGAGANVGGAVAGWGSARRGRTTTSQSTLTVVVRFDEASRVSSVSLHASRF